MRKLWPEGQTVSEIRKLLQNSCLDILAVSETRLATTITDHGEIGIGGYFAIRKGGHSNGGYVLINVLLKE